MLGGTAVEAGAPAGGPDIGSIIQGHMTDRLQVAILVLVARRACPFWRALEEAVSGNTAP